MGNTISMEQLDGMIAERERERESIRLKIVAMQELRVLFFGTDGASGGGQTSEPVKVAPVPIPRTRRRAATKETRPLNTCVECKKTWPRSKTVQKRSCPECGSDAWAG